MDAAGMRAYLAATRTDAAEPEAAAGSDAHKSEAARSVPPQAEAAQADAGTDGRVPAGAPKTEPERAGSPPVVSGRAKVPSGLLDPFGTHAGPSIPAPVGTGWDVTAVGGSRIRIVASAKVPSAVCTPTGSRISTDARSAVAERRSARIAAAEIKWQAAKSSTAGAVEDDAKPPAPFRAVGFARVAQSVKAVIAEASGASADTAVVEDARVARPRVPAAGVREAAETPRVPAAGVQEAAETPRVPAVGAPAAAETVLRAAVMDAGVAPGPAGRAATDTGGGAPVVLESAGDRGIPVGGGAGGGAGTAVRKKGFVRRSLLPVSVAAAAAFVAATGYLAVTDPRGDADVGRWAGAGPVAAAEPQRPESRLPESRLPEVGPSGLSQAWARASANPNPFGVVPDVLQGPPTRLRIKAIGMDTALETLHLGADGALTPPANFAKAGWYADGTAPGDSGPAIIAGHVDSQRGPAVFYKLREMVPGDKIEVVRGGKTVRFTVVSTAWYPKAKFPTEQVYGPTPDRQLRLITCGGVFDHSLRSYKDNLVVYAVAG
jgi:sortase family protein